MENTVNVYAILFVYQLRHLFIILSEIFNLIRLKMQHWGLSFSKMLQKL